MMSTGCDDAGADDARDVVFSRPELTASKHKLRDRNADSKVVEVLMQGSEEAAQDASISS